MKTILSRRVAIGIVLALLVSLNLAFFLIRYQASALQTWPSSWIVIDWDKNEDGSADDWRDVEYAFYQYDSDYLYLKIQCYNVPGGEWPAGNARYKWFVDTDGNMYYSGGNIFDAEYLLFVEDTNYDGNGEMYIVQDVHNNNNFNEYEPWPPANYVNYKITDPDIGGFSIVAPNQIEMYIKWTSIGTPPSYGLFWATDQANPNLDQGPTTDRVDEEQVIIVHNVAAVSQVPTPQVVHYCHGEHVSIAVVVANTGTQIETFNVTCYFNNTLIGTQLVSNLAAGHQTTLTFDWNTSGLPVGNYTITAWADSSAAIAEIDETDNWCISPATVSIVLESIHDVAAISQVPDKTAVMQGTTVYINVTVSNLGNLAETFNVTSFYDNSPIGYKTVTNLAPQVSTSMIFAWDTTGVAPGTYYIRAVADSSRNIIEIDEDNNNCTTLEAVTIYSSSDMGKLCVYKSKTAIISGADPPIVGLPTVYELTITVTNVGNSTLSNVFVNETISDDATFVSVGIPSQGSIIAVPPPKITWNVGNLGSGMHATLAFRVSITPASLGLIYVNHKEDIIASGLDILNHPVSDVGDIDITATPIIRDVAAINQVPSCTIVNQGETIAVFVTVKNLGNASETFDVECHYDTNLIGVIRIYDLAAGDQTTISFALDTTSIPPGTYSIIAEADSSHEIWESDETNNLCTSESTIEIVVHDVAVISQNPSPTTVIQGETVTIEVPVKNEGTETETFDISCYYNDAFLEMKTVTSLTPGSTLTLYFIWNTTEVPAGTYFINTEAIPVPGERDTANNACKSVASVTVTAQQYYLTVSSPYGITGGEGWYSNGSTAYATLNIGVIDHGNGTRRMFTFWSVDASGTDYAQSYPILMNASKTAVANWKTQYYLTVSSPYDTPTPTSGWFDAGTTITDSVTSPWAGSAGTRYVCTGWTGTGSVAASGTAQSTTFTINAPSSIMWNWKTQYYLAVGTYPSGIATIPGEGWYDAYATVPLTAPDVFDYNFTEWIVGALSEGSGVKSISVTMDAPYTATAYYERKGGVIVGGSTFSIKSPQLNTWISINVAIFAALFITASWTRKKKRKTS